MKTATSGAAIFLDRDGTLIREVGYLSRPEQLELLPGVGEALRRLRDFGFKLVVVTNQSAVARGYLSERELAAIHVLLRERLAAERAFLDAIYYCPHHPTEGFGDYRVACNCRKPNPGMVYQAVEELELNPTGSYLIGDHETDMQLAKLVGATGILLQDASGAPEAPRAEVAAFADLWQAGQWIVARERGMAERTERR
jgi:D-glycero-D-manno-heptose 1,7-bisphosphate phosphatase